MKSNLFLTLTVAGLFASSVASGQIAPPDPPGGVTPDPVAETPDPVAETPADPVL